MATLPNNPNGPIYGTNGDDSGSKALVGTFEYSDTIYGGDEKDEVHGRFGADYLDGGNGNDKLWGDAGNDVEVGGKGNDQFNFAWQMGQDTINDFHVAGINVAGDTGRGGETDSVHTYDLYSEGQWFSTQATWLSPTDVNGDGKLDAVLQVWSPEWVAYANQTQWRGYNADGQPGTGDDYKQSDMKDTVTFLGWGGDVNHDNKADYLSIYNPADLSVDNFEHHAHTADINSGYFFV